MNTMNRILYGVEIVREDGSTFLASGGGQGIMPALFVRITAARKHRAGLRARGFAAQPPIPLRVRIEPA